MLFPVKIQGTELLRKLAQKHVIESRSGLCNSDNFTAGACVNPLLSPCFVISVYIFWVARGFSMFFFGLGLGLFGFFFINF